MATINLGRIKPVFRGAYSGGTAYVVDDIVTQSNETFICIQAHGAGTQATSVTAYWSKLAAKGTDGTDVGTTITTQGDILFRDGSGLQRLAKGAAEKVLSINSATTAPEWTDVDITALPTITVAKGGTNLSSFTAGDVLYATGSTTLAKLTASGHGSKTLKMNSGATAPEWTTVAAASSDYVHLSTTTLGSAASSFSVDGWVSSTYKHYRILGYFFSSATNSGWLQGRWNVAGSAYTATEYANTTNSAYATSTGYLSSNVETYFSLAQTSTTALRYGQFEITLYDPINTTNYTTHTLVAFGSAGTNIHAISGGGSLRHTAAVTGITFYERGGGTIDDTSTVSIYGLKG